MIVPPKGRVVIRKDEPKNKTGQGIYLGKNDRERSVTGEIVSITGGSYKVGQRIVFAPRVSSTVNFMGENLVTMSNNDIISTI